MNPEKARKTERIAKKTREIRIYLKYKPQNP